MKRTYRFRVLRVPFLLDLLVLIILYKAYNATGTMYFEADAVKFPMTDGINPPFVLCVRRFNRLPPIFCKKEGRTPMPDACNKSRPGSAATGSFAPK